VPIILDAAHEDQRHHRMVWTLVNASQHDGCPCAGCRRGACWVVSVGYIHRQSRCGMPRGKIRAPSNVYDHIVEFLKRNHGRKLREVMDAEIDISDVIQ
jgi:hypothetical protein